MLYNYTIGMSHRIIDHLDLLFFQSRRLCKRNDTYTLYKGSKLRNLTPIIWNEVNDSCKPGLQYWILYTST